MSEAPYPGLRPFQRGEIDIFFGREGQVDVLVDLLAQWRFLSVVGPSGSGKSSLVRAGLLDALESGFMATAGAGWIVADMRPGSQPMLRLAKTLLAVSGRDRHQHDSEFLKASLERGRNSIVDFLNKEGLLAQDDNLLILVDQFEELFRFEPGKGPDEAETFVALLLAAFKQKEWPVYVVITMRSDFIGGCARFPNLTEAVNDAQFLTPRLTREQSRLAIEEPARVFDGVIEGSLVNRLLNDMGTDPDQLPLMQHALMRMWSKATKASETPNSITLTSEDYEAVGGLKEALSQHANEAYNELPKQDQAAAQSLFRVLTERGADRRDLRRPTQFRTIVQVVAGGEATDAVRKQVIRAAAVFRREDRSFLMPQAHVPLDDTTVLDISHESLIRQWDRLRDWTAEEADAADTYRELLPPAQRWQEKEGGWWGNLGSLLRGFNLTRALKWKQSATIKWAKLYGGDFQSVEQFIQASRTYSVFRLVVFIATFALVLVVLGGGSFYFQQQKAESALKLQQQQSALKQLELQEQLTATSEQARKAAVKALKETDEAKAETEKALIKTQQAEERASYEEKKRTSELFDSQITHASLLVRGEDYAEAREMLAQSRVLDEKIPLERRHARNFLTRFVEIMGGNARQVYQGANAILYSVAISPNGQLLAVVGEKGTVVLFDVESSELRQRLKGHDKDVHDVVFHPTGEWFATGGKDGQIIRWSLPSDNVPAVQLQAWKAPGEVWSLAISPNGKLLASGGPDNDVSLWKAMTGRFIRHLKGHTNAISTSTGLAFSPSGKRLASASYDNTARIWDVETGESLVILRGHTNNVNGVLFTPDEQRISTSSTDKRIVLWEVKSGRPIRIFTGHENLVDGLGFVARDPIAKKVLSRPDEEAPLLVSASFDRTLRVWDTDSGVALRVLEGHSTGVIGIAVHTPQEKTKGVQVFSASNDGTVRRWDIAPLPHQRLVEIPKEARSTAISPDGQYAAVGFANGALRLYSPEEGHLLEEQKEAHEEHVTCLCFSASGNLLASASFDNTARLWAVAPDGNLTAQQTFRGHRRGLRYIAFSPDERTLATASNDGLVGLFGIGTEEKQFFKPFDGKRVMSVTFHPDGNRLLATGEQEISLWDLSSDPPSLVRAFPQAFDQLFMATLSPNGRSFARVGRQAVVEVYSTQDAQLQHRLVGHENTVYRANFSPDGRQLATVSADATVRLWDLETGRELFSLRLPTHRYPPEHLWDFDFRCTPSGCWVAVPLTRGKLALYNLGLYAE